MYLFYRVLLSRKKILACVVLFCLGTTAVRTLLILGKEEELSLGYAPGASLHRKTGKGAGSTSSASLSSTTTHTSRKNRRKQGSSSRSARSKGGKGSSSTKDADGGSQIGAVAKDLRARKTKTRSKARRQQGATGVPADHTPSSNMMQDETGAYIWMETEFEPDNIDDISKDTPSDVLLMEEDKFVEEEVIHDIDINDEEPSFEDDGVSDDDDDDDKVVEQTSFKNGGNSESSSAQKNELPHAETSQTQVLRDASGERKNEGLDEDEDTPDELEDIMTKGNDDLSVEDGGEATRLVEKMGSVNFSEEPEDLLGMNIEDQLSSGSRKLSMHEGCS